MSFAFLFVDWGATDGCRDSDLVDIVRGAIGVTLGRLSPIVIKVNSQVIPVA